MSSWGKYDNAANAPYWAVNSTITHTANSAANSMPTAANVAALYTNTTADAYIVDQTIGLFNVSPHEVQVAEVSPTETKVTHTGWVLKTTGSGGRANRVQQEVLVALSETLGPVDGDGQIYANTYITLTDPVSGTVYANTLNANAIIFTTTATEVGNTTGVLYQWQVNSPNGSLGWTNVANSTPSNTSYSGGTTNTLYVYPRNNTTSNNYVFRVVATAAQDNQVTATSANATMTVL